MFAEIRGDGFARPNRFEALFFPPTGRTSINPFQEVINRYGLRAYKEGWEVYTTIDSNSQRIAYSSLLDELFTYWF